MRRSHQFQVATSAHTSTPVRIGQNRLLTVKEIAERLAVSERTVRRLIKNEILPPHYIGRSVRILEAEFQAFLARTRRY